MTVYVGMSRETLKNFHRRLGEELAKPGQIEVLMEKVGADAEEVVFSNDDMENRDDVGVGTVFVQHI